MFTPGVVTCVEKVELCLCEYLLVLSGMVKKRICLSDRRQGRLLQEQKRNVIKKREKDQNGISDLAMAAATFSERGRRTEKWFHTIARNSSLLMALHKECPDVVWLLTLALRSAHALPRAWLTVTYAVKVHNCRQTIKRSRKITWLLSTDDKQIGRCRS